MIGELRLPDLYPVKESIMGIFSSKTKTYYGTSVVRVVQDKDIVPSIKIGSVKSIFSKEELSDSICEELLVSLGNRAKSFYRYGRDHYVYGLPSGQVLTPTDGIPLVQTVLDTLEGAPVSIRYSFFSEINFPHLAQRLMDDQFNYNGATNELVVLSAIKGRTVTFSYLTLSMSRAKHASLPLESIKVWDKTTRIVFDESLTTIRASVHYTWVTPAEILETDISVLTEDLTLTNQEFGQEYFHASYTIGAETKYWEYKAGIGTYPLLDAFIYAEHEPSGSYMPFTLFRSGKVSMDAYVGQPVYETSKTLVKKLGLDYADLIASINSNPDITDVDQAIMIMAVPADTTNEAEQMYLYRYFDNNFVVMNGQTTVLSDSELSAAFGLGAGVPAAIQIQDGYFGMGVAYEGIYKRLVTGVIGAVGTYGSRLGSIQYSTEYTSELGFPYSVITELPAHIYQKQVTATQYQEIVVVGLAISYSMHGLVIAGGTGIRFVSVGEADKALFLLPLDYSITSGMPFRLREELYARSLHFVFNSVQTVKIKWYQQTFFKFVMIVAAVVILFFSYGTEWKMLAWAISLGVTGYVAVVVAIIAEVALFMATRYLVKLFVKEVGIEFAFVAAMVAMATGVASNLGAIELPAGLAASLLALSSGLSLGVSLNLKDAMEGIKDEAEAAKKEQDAQWDLLSKAEELLDPPKLAPYMFFGESAENYFNRTVHTGNIGIIGVSAVSNYVERSLSLPTLPERFGGYSHV
jgi:hypothetical protein